MLKKKTWLLVLLFVSGVFSPAIISAAEIGEGIKVTFLGQSAFKIVGPEGQVTDIDPFLKDNPETPPAMKEVRQADLILLTHGHADHLGDTPAIAQKTNAQVIAMSELARFLTQRGVKNAVRMNKGGTASTKGIRITMVNALHSSAIIEGDRILYAGEPAGFILRFGNGFTIYHAGDTAVFSDMKILAELYRPFSLGPDRGSCAFSFGSVFGYRYPDHLLSGSAFLWGTGCGLCLFTLPA